MGFSMDHFNMPNISYFELSWSILSSIGLFTTLLAIWAVLITRPSPLSYIPIIVSAACAAANGLCYFSYYTTHSLRNRMVASAFADLFWLIQEAGLSFYSYQILRNTLRYTARNTFLAIFWTLMLTIVSLRLAILVIRLLALQSSPPSSSSSQYSDSNKDNLQNMISHLHIGYFITIALIESWSSFFLIRLLHRAQDVSPKLASTRCVFRYLLRTTELRLASLCVIGVTRAVTYSWQVTAQTAESVPGEVDRFVYAVECLFPAVLIIDILASKKYSPLQSEEGEVSPRLQSSYTSRRMGNHVRVPTSDSWPQQRCIL